MTSVIDTLTRPQLAVIRSMSLNPTAHAPRKIYGTAKVASEARAAFKDVGVAGLVAQPMNSFKRLSLHAPFFGYHHRPKTLLFCPLQFYGNA